ncbi:MBL fold metallo-hydrolase [Cyclobacterium amurskyense]|uniref:MBL fold metallo-hydrolase n=1 Tax=Cyclobacterium amurskyense TaxID=320787 RepID=UPI0030DB3348|tara:strand:- start:2220 stop:3323 length:1104 start_codon:yes stop_codon:yes gene_type:complete
MEQKEINTNTLREWLDTGKKVNILDVRPFIEREELKIPGSIHIDAYDELKKNNPDPLEVVDFDKSIPVVTVCAGGKTSSIAAEILQNSGYETYNLQGGMKSWSLSWNTASIVFDNFEIIQFRRAGKGCLSYVIISDQEAMVIDVSLPVEIYKEFLDQRELILKYVADIHIHADHLSRTKELAEKNKIKPSLPSNDKLNYPFNPIAYGQYFSIGRINVKSIHTPGHTLESTSYLIDGKVVLTGDTLFTNGVGRPDLKADKEEAEKKATLLFHSIQKLIRLDQSIIVLPGHTSQPVAFDNQPIQSELKEVVKNTPLLKESEQEFVQSLLKRIPNPPENYLKIVEKNITGDFTDVNPIDLEAGANRCAIS